MKRKLTFLLAASLLAITVNAQQTVETKGARNTVIFEATGAWCGHCGDGAVYLKNALTGNAKAIGVAVHNSDGMAFSDGNTLNSAFAGGYPSGYIDMHVFSGTTAAALNRGQWASRASSRTSLTADVDVKLEYSYNSSTREVTATVTVTALTDNLKNTDLSANIILTEDKVVGPNGSQYSQTNYSAYNNNPNHPHYNLGSKIDGFEHMHVLRAMFEGPWGKDLGKKLAMGETAMITKKYTIPAKYNVVNANPDNMHIVAYVQETSKATNKKNTTDAQVFNSVEGKLTPVTTGIGNIAQVVETRVYPNPAQGFINIKAQLSTPAEATVTVKNMIGQTVYQKEYAKGNSMLADNISTENFANGVYTVTVSSNGENSVQKIIVNK